MRSIYTIILISLVAQSCSMLGSRSYVVNQPAQKPKHVAVIISQHDAFDSQSANTESFLITKTLAEELARKKIFRFTILDRKYQTEAMDDFQLSLLGTELMNEYDAYLICNPQPKGRFNHKMQLRLYQTQPTVELIYVSHNSSTGNAYGWYPSTNQTLVDATRGVVEALEREYGKIKP